MTPNVVFIPKHIGPRSAGMSMTLEEFDAIPLEAFKDHYRYELLRGVLVVSPLPGNAEIDPNEELGHLLWFYQQQDPRGSVIDKTLPEQTIPTRENRRRCDRAIWIGLGRIPDPEADTPAIVIEFVSKSRRDVRRDYEEKLAEYMQIGVREYWIVDRFRRTMTVYRNRPGGVETSVIAESQVYQTDLLPGFVMPLAHLLRKADDWMVKRHRSPAGGTESDG